MSIATSLVLVILLGVVAQWAAASLRAPSILLLLLSGFIVGPVTGLLDPDALLGELLFPMVSLSVAIILFEGALSLRIDEIKQVGNSVRMLLSVGLVCTWILSALFAYYLLGFEAGFAALIGAVLTVTGPTVILPLLRHIRLKGQIRSVLKWEGIVIDPIGAVLAILVFEVLVDATPADTISDTIWSVTKALASGGGLGALGAIGLTQALRRNWVPEYLHNPLSLTTLLTVFVMSNEMQHESGLIAVTVMGFMLTNQTRVPVRHIIEFKETLGTLLLAVLFVILAARVDVKVLFQINLPMIFFLLALVFIVRPLSVLVSTFNQDITWRERVFLCFMAPRGIVAAAVASILALDLTERGFPSEQADLLVAVVFVVVVGTVGVYGLTARPLARMLGLAGSEPEGVLIVGAHDWAQDLANALHTRGIDSVLLDTNTANITSAKLRGLPAVNGSVMEEETVAHLDLDGIGRLFALTTNDEINSLAALKLSRDFGRNRVYQISPYQDPKQSTVARELRGRALFDRALTYSRFAELFALGWRIRTTKLTKEFPFSRLLDQQKNLIYPLLYLTEDGTVVVKVATEKFEPRPGQYVISLSAPELPIADSVASKNSDSV
ncbi:MAG: cation:proton antiporter [bacterium]|nr:cation:proton antiporter [bacterium]